MDFFPLLSFVTIFSYTLEVLRVVDVRGGGGALDICKRAERVRQPTAVLRGEFVHAAAPASTAGGLTERGIVEGASGERGTDVGEWWLWRVEGVAAEQPGVISRLPACGQRMR